jgi:hypothetical protein
MQKKLRYLGRKLGIDERFTEKSAASSLGLLWRFISIFHNVNRVGRDKEFREFR